MPLHKNGSLGSHLTLSDQLQDIIRRYFQTHGTKTKQKLQQEYYKHTKSQQMDLDGQRTMQLKSFDPFKNDSPAEFFDIEYMFGIKEFNIVIGNPPYGAKYESAFVDIYRAHYSSAQNKDGARGSLDTYVLFTELGLKLLKPQGNLCYIVPMSIISSDSSERLHIVLETQTSTIKVSSYSRRPRPIFETKGGIRVSILSFKKAAHPTTSSSAKIYTTKMYKKKSRYHG